MRSSGPYNSQSFATASFSTDSSLEFDPLDNSSSDNSSSSSGSDHAALVAGPSWRVLLSAEDFADLVHMLAQLRMAVASLRYQCLWNAGTLERPPSKAKVCMFRGRAFTVSIFDLADATCLMLVSRARGAAQAIRCMCQQPR